MIWERKIGYSTVSGDFNDDDENNGVIIWDQILWYSTRICAREVEMMMTIKIKV